MRISDLLIMSLVASTAAGWDARDLSIKLGPDFGCGVAVTDITPPAGFPMQTTKVRRISTGVHDPLLAKALVFSQAKETAAVIVADLARITPELATEIRHIIERRTGIPSDHVIFAVTHTGNGPALSTNRVVASTGGSSGSLIDYEVILCERIAEAVLAAQRRVQPAQLDAGRTDVPSGAFRPGGGLTLAGSPSAIPNAGATAVAAAQHQSEYQPLSTIIVSETKNKRPLAGLSVYPLAPSITRNSEFTADYGFYFEKALGKAFGEQFVSMLASGSCLDAHDATTVAGVAGFSEAERLGGALALAMVSNMATFNPVRPMLAIKSRSVLLPEAQESSSIFTGSTGGSESDREALLEKARLLLASDSWMLRGTIPAEVQVLRLARDLAIVSLPAPLAEAALSDIRAISPFGHTLVLEQCRTAALQEREGTGTDTPPPYTALLVQTAGEMLRELKPKKVEMEYYVPRLKGLP